MAAARGRGFPRPGHPAHARGHRGVRRSRLTSLAPVRAAGLHVSDVRPDDLHVLVREVRIAHIVHSAAVVGSGHHDLFLILPAHDALTVRKEADLSTPDLLHRYLLSGRVRRSISLPRSFGNRFGGAVLASSASRHSGERIASTTEAE